MQPNAIQPNPSPGGHSFANNLQPTTVSAAHRDDSRQRRHEQPTHSTAQHITHGDQHQRTPSAARNKATAHTPTNSATQVIITHPHTTNHTTVTFSCSFIRSSSRPAQPNRTPATPPPPPHLPYTPTSQQATTSSREQPHSHTQSKRMPSCHPQSVHEAGAPRPPARAPSTQNDDLPTSTTTVLHVAQRPLPTAPVGPQLATKSNPTQPNPTQPNPLTPFLRQPRNPCRHQRRTPGRQPSTSSPKPHTQHSTTHHTR